MNKALGYSWATPAGEEVFENLLDQLRDSSATDDLSVFTMRSKCGSYGEN